MYASTSLADLVQLQAPQVLGLVYLAALGAVLPVLLKMQQAARDGLNLGRIAGIVSLAAVTIFAVFVMTVLVALVTFYLPGAVLKVVFAGTALLLLGGAVISGWVLRRRTIGWLRSHAATSSIDDSRLHMLADRHTLYDFGTLGLLLIFMAVGIAAVAPVVPNPGMMSNAWSLETLTVLLGAGVVWCCVHEALRRIFPDAVLLEVYRGGMCTARLVDLCDRCFSREIARAPESLRAVYRHSAEKTLASMATALHRTEGDGAAVHAAVHDALAPRLSLGGQDVVHRLGSGTPSLRTDLMRLASFVALVAGFVGSIRILIGVVVPVIG